MCKLVLFMENINLSQYTNKQRRKKEQPESSCIYIYRQIDRQTEKVKSMATDYQDLRCNMPSLEL